MILTALESLNLILVISFWVHIAGLVAVVVAGLFYENDQNEHRFGQTFAYCVFGALASLLGALATNLLS